MHRCRCRWRTTARWTLYNGYCAPWPALKVAVVLERLHTRLSHTGPGQDVTLTIEEEAAYQATADRFNAMWALGSGIDRFIY